MGGGKNAWQDKWKCLGVKPDTVYYDVFAHYTGENVNIVPENICHDVVERILNPVHYDGYYADKNNFDKIFPKGFLPATILRKINGFYFDADYFDVEMSDSRLRNILNDSGFGKVIVKPTLDSCSGKGVIMAKKQVDGWAIVGTNKTLNYDYLEKEYGADFIIQEALEQSEYIGQFNSTSVNTLRLTVYRSVKTNRCVVPSAILRIGAKGNILDNAHAGGGFTALHLNGRLGNKVFNQYGQSVTTFNGIDFTGQHQIPDFDKIIKFAKQVGGCVLHHRLLALDVMIDNYGNPKLIEFNSGTSGAYSMWLFQYTGTSAFGEYTDEIIEYCKAHLDDARMQIYI